MLEVYVIIHDPSGGIAGVKFDRGRSFSANVERMANLASAEWCLVSMVGIDTSKGRGPVEVPVSLHRQGLTLSAPPHPAIPLGDLVQTLYGPTVDAARMLFENAESIEEEEQDPRIL